MPARVIVLLDAYKYIKRCLPLIYSINCLKQIPATLDYMRGNNCARLDGSRLGSRCCCLFEWTVEDLIKTGTFGAENFRSAAERIPCVICSYFGLR